MLTISKRQMLSMSHAQVDNGRAELRYSIDKEVRRAQAANEAGNRLAALVAMTYGRLGSDIHSGRWLKLEVEAAAETYAAALAEGMPYDESLAAGLLAAAAAIGAQWPADVRLYPHGTKPPGSLLTLWHAGAGSSRPDVADALAAALEAAETLHAPAVDALARWLLNPNSPRAQRRLHRVVFGANADKAAAFEASEVMILDAAGLTDPAVRRICIAANTAFGHRRFVRIAALAAADGRPPIDDLHEACHGLVQDADR